MTEYYYLNSRNQPQGPHSLDELAGLMASGRVNPTTLVACKGAATWEPLGTVLSRENIEAPAISLTPGQIGCCPTCGRDLAAEAEEGKLPARCSFCGRHLRPAKPGIWANYMLALRNYFKFSGRATRAEYWCFQLINCLILFILYIGLVVTVVTSLIHLESQELDSAAEEGMTVTDMVNNIMSGAPWAIPVFFICLIGIILFALFTFIPSISVMVRRLHDIGWSGWWLGGSFILSFVINIFMHVLESSPEGQAEHMEEVFTTTDILVVLFLIISYGYSIFLFVLTLLDSQRGVNTYGPSSKYPLG